MLELKGLIVISRTYIFVWASYTVESIYIARNLLLSYDLDLRNHCGFEVWFFKCLLRDLDDIDF